MLCRLLPCVRPSASEVIEPSLPSVSPGAANEGASGIGDSKMMPAMNPLSPEALHLIMENAVVIRRVSGKAGSPLPATKEGSTNQAVHPLPTDAAQQESNRRTSTVSTVGSALGLPVPPSAAVMAIAHPYYASFRHSTEGLQLQPVLEESVAAGAPVPAGLMAAVSADPAAGTPCHAPGATLDTHLHQSPSPSPSGPPITTHFDLAAIASGPLAHLANVMTAADEQEQQQQLAQQQLLQTRTVREHAAAVTSPAPAPVAMPYTRPVTAADILTGACSTRALAPARAPWGATMAASPLQGMYSPLHLGMQPQANMAATVAAVLTGQHLHTQTAPMGAAHTRSGLSSGTAGSGGQVSSTSPASTTASSRAPPAAIPPGPLHMAQDRHQEQQSAARADMTPYVVKQQPAPHMTPATLPAGPLVSARSTPPHAAGTLHPTAGVHTPASHGYPRGTPPSGGSSNHLSSNYHLRNDRPTHKPRVQIDANTLRGPNPYGFQPVLIMSPQELARQQAQGTMGGSSRRLGSMAAGTTLFSRASGRQQGPGNQYVSGRHGYTGAGQGCNNGYGTGGGQPVRSKIGSASSRMALSALSNGSAYSTTSRGGSRAAGPGDFRPRWR